MGTFALITLILAGAAIGRLLGLRLTEALYIGALVVVGPLNIAYRFIGQRRRKG
jgi:Kef-type K+ transport system membrane component KefB